MNRSITRPKSHKRLLTLIFTVLLAATIGGGGAAASPAPAKGSITIHKFLVDSFENLREGTGSPSDASNLPAGAEKLEGITFRLEKQGDSAFMAVTKATDKNGEIVFPGLEEGIYRVTELLPEGYSAQNGQFLVPVPLEGRYDVHVYPKNMGKGGTIAKKLDAEKRVYGLEEDIPWAMEYPLDGGTKKNFCIYDQMDPRLDYVAGSAALAFLDADRRPASGVSCAEGTGYTERYDANGHVVTWAFTDAAVQKLTAQGVKYIAVKLRTRVNETALGTSARPVWNNAGLQFTNAAGDPSERQVFDPGKGTEGANVPKAWLGSIAVVKVSAGDGREKLAGAVFKLAADEASAKAGRYLQRDGKDMEVTTDAQGKALFDILGAGTYYLTETKAPSGYRQLKAPVQAVIGNDPEKRLASLEITNQPQGKEGKPGPVTGDDVKLLAYVLLGAGAAAGLTWLFWPKKKKQNADSDQ
ncbi:MAG: SpaH/EbpB family LPXTG-anchored major pilin [Oscillospiraceae bacterium]|nr:SpaH/EbpB family LPXTG-anchored major pilin [Oscillospiraceae bacterium]